eukprot:scaffold227995_cov35-Tisochrysis_lutea.AAC.2
MSLALSISSSSIFECETADKTGVPVVDCKGIFSSVYMAEMSPSTSRHERLNICALGGAMRFGRE